MSLPTTGRIPRAYAWTVVRLRWPIAAAWAAAAAYAAFILPAPVQPPDSLVSLVPHHSAAVRAESIPAGSHGRSGRGSSPRPSASIAVPGRTPAPAPSPFP
jgi:uncharacterized membrane protein YdfJ with MMPL/SSD domain